MGSGSSLVDVFGVCGVGIDYVEQAMKLWVVDDAKFEQFLALETPVKVLIFTVKGCLYCSEMVSVLDELVEPYRKQASFGRIDALETKLTLANGVTSVPLLIAYRSDGSVIDTLLGLRDKLAVENWIKRLIKIHKFNKVKS
jgi:thioredoxin-like negative regulator of GroEL